MNIILDAKRIANLDARARKRALVGASNAYRVISMIRSHPEMTTDEIAQKLGVCRDTVFVHIVGREERPARKQRVSAERLFDLPVDQFINERPGGYRLVDVQLS
jgi:DNA-directed RNA polymerase specialized sigma24 family protein